MSGEQQNLPTIITFTPDNLFGPHPVATGEIAEAREELAKVARKGASCPCCRQFVKVYRMPFRWSAAFALVHMVRDVLARAAACLTPGGIEEQRQQYIHLPSFLQGLDVLDDKAKAALCGGGGPVVFLVPWKLIEKQPGGRDDGSWRTGLYRPTVRGVDFAQGRTVISKFIYTYNGRPLEFDGPGITIREALGQRFDYDEVMGG